MPDLLSASLDERREAIEAGAAVLGGRAIRLEKDLFVCWVLRELFAMPGRLDMAFKGGTALSKIYRAIERFSEDVDVSIDYHEFALPHDPFDPDITRKKRDENEAVVFGRVRDHARDVVRPFFEVRLAEQFPGEVTRADLLVEDKDISVVVHCPSAFEPPTYLGQGVKIEFGGRNPTEPALENVEFTADLTGVPALAGYGFPVARVKALHGKRTFWEKATLIHAECHKWARREDAAEEAAQQGLGRGRKIARHWYDLYKLSEHTVGREALDDLDLLAEVARHKHAFFYAASADYGACTRGGLQLVPGDTLARALRRDYADMTGAEELIVGDAPEFDAILMRMAELEERINARTGEASG